MSKMTNPADYKPSIVVNCENYSGHSCGYCQSKDTFFRSGIWAHRLTVEDYQDLIDRGWRRCGQYCYKPRMELTCCPMYTIRCAAGEFRISKSQKKILKKFNKFLAHGTAEKNVKKSVLSNTGVVHAVDVRDADCNYEPKDNKNLEVLRSAGDGASADDAAASNQPLPKMMKKSETAAKAEESGDGTAKACTEKPGGKSRQMKAKYLRIARKRQKLKDMGLDDEEIDRKMREKKKQVTVKTVEDYLNEAMPENPAHKLEMRLVRCGPELDDTFDEVFELYKRYQISTHNDSPEELERQRFERFLVVSPLQIRLVLVNSPEFDETFTETMSLFAKYQQTVHNESEVDCSAVVFTKFLVRSALEPTDIYGSYHQQYWLDGKLIAVGVLDVLPQCVSSVYFLYDPDYLHLSLGTYGALREIEFVRKLTVRYPELKYYYMGYYIHSCVKMKYKAAFKPSYLLCPQTYTWHDIRSCLPKLDASKYSRLNDDPYAEDKNSNILVSEVSVLYKRIAMSFASYTKQKGLDAEEREEVLTYADLVGMVCAKKMLLYRP